MRFSCGENWGHRQARLAEWHPFFPLFPRTIKTVDGRDICAWLEWIERRGKEYWFEFGWEWEYREAQK